MKQRQQKNQKLRKIDFKQIKKPGKEYDQGCRAGNDPYIPVSLFFVIRESKDEGKFHLTGVGTDGDVISCSDNRVHHFFVGRNINGVLADQRCRNVVTCILINFQSGTGECCKILKDKGNL